MRSKTYLLALNGVIAAAYAALTLVAAALNLAYGPVQFRFSEALTVLPFLFPGTWPGVFGVPGGKPAQPLRPAGRGPGLGLHPGGRPADPEGPEDLAGPLPRWCAVWYSWAGCWPGMRWAFPTSFSPSSQPMRCGWASARRCPAMGWGCPCCGLLRKVSYFRRFIPEDRRAFGLRPESKKNSRFPSARGSGCSHPWPRFSKARITRSRVCSTSWPLQSMVR